MARTWIFLRHPLHTESDVSFSVESSDFSEDGADRVIGHVIINKGARTYRFTPAGPWGNEPFIPPEIWALPDDERKKLLSGKYSKSHFLSHSFSIHQAVCRRLASQDWD
jgi:hypothetical protein